jgi:hypothetical protein
MRRACFLLLGLFGCGACGNRAGPPASTPPGPTGVPVAPDAACREPAYIPATGPSPSAPRLPRVPDLPEAVTRDGDAFTVAGAVHAHRSRFEADAVDGKDVRIVGFIVDENASSAPRCAVHRTGKKDPEGCRPEIPSFTLADTPSPAPDAPRLRVLGWASSFAQIVEAQLADAAMPAGASPKRLRQDDLWGLPLPHPLPAVGARVKVTGRLAATFTLSTGGIEQDAVNGLVTYRALETISPAPKPLALPR